MPSASSDAPGLPEGLEHLELVCAAVGMRSQGGAPLVVEAEPAPTEDTAGVELASAAKGAAIATPEVLAREPWAEGEAGCGHNTAPQDESTEGERVLDARGHGQAHA